MKGMDRVRKVRARSIKRARRIAFWLGPHPDGVVLLSGGTLIVGAAVLSAIGDPSRLHENAALEGATTTVCTVLVAVLTAVVPDMRLPDRPSV
jgi:hypothetical protein